MISYQEAKKRLTAAVKLFDDESTTRDKFNSVRTLVKDIHPNIDATLKKCAEALATLDKVQEGDVIMLSAENLPENTEDQKKRKKYLLLFITNWRQLKREIIRVQAEMDAADHTDTTGEYASHWGNILKSAKGPLGVITVLAVGTVAAMHFVAVDIVIHNNGCETFYPSSAVPIALPGLSFPDAPIVDGSVATATLPGLPLNVDGTTPGVLTLKVLTYTYMFQLPSSISAVTLDGQSLLNTKTTVSLLEHDTHELVLECL